MDYICGDLVTLKNDDILRVVHHQNKETNIVRSDWFCDIEEDFKMLFVHKDELKLIERTVTLDDM